MHSGQNFLTIPSVQCSVFWGGCLDWIPAHTQTHICMSSVPQLPPGTVTVSPGSELSCSPLGAPWHQGAVPWAGCAWTRQWISLAWWQKPSTDLPRKLQMCFSWVCQCERSRGVPSQAESEFLLVLSTAGDWSVNIEPNKLLVSKILSVMRSCLITIWSTSDHALVCRAVPGLVLLPILWFLRSA